MGQHDLSRHVELDYLNDKRIAHADKQKVALTTLQVLREILDEPLCGGSGGTISRLVLCLVLYSTFDEPGLYSICDEPACGLPHIQVVDLLGG